jgi:hypothetical protein
MQLASLWQILGRDVLTVFVSPCCSNGVVMNSGFHLPSIKDEGYVDANTGVQHAPEYPEGIFQANGKSPADYQVRVGQQVKIMRTETLHECLVDALQKLRTMKLNYSSSGQNGSLPTHHFMPKDRYDVLWVW